MGASPQNSPGDSNASMPYCQDARRLDLGARTSNVHRSSEERNYLSFTRMSVAISSPPRICPHCYGSSLTNFWLNFQVRAPPTSGSQSSSGYVVDLLSGAFILCTWPARVYCTGTVSSEGPEQPDAKQLGR
jgi:hypothetical protein